MSKRKGNTVQDEMKPLLDISSGSGSSSGDAAGIGPSGFSASDGTQHGDVLVAVPETFSLLDELPDEVLYVFLRDFFTLEECASLRAVSKRYRETVDAILPTDAQVMHFLRALKTFIKQCQPYLMLAEDDFDGVARRDPRPGFFKRCCQGFSCEDLSDPAYEALDAVGEGVRSFSSSYANMIDLFETILSSAYTFYFPEGEDDRSASLMRMMLADFRDRVNNQAELAENPFMQRLLNALEEQDHLKVCFCFIKMQSSDAIEQDNVKADVEAVVQFCFGANAPVFLNMGWCREVIKTLQEVIGFSEVLHAVCEVGSFVTDQLDIHHRDEAQMRALQRFLLGNVAWVEVLIQRLVEQPDLARAVENLLVASVSGNITEHHLCALGLEPGLAQKCAEVINAVHEDVVDAVAVGELPDEDLYDDDDPDQGAGVRPRVHS